MCMFFLSVWFIGGGFSFILPFFTTGDGCNGPQATEKIQLSRGQTLPVSCATVNVKAHTDICSKISDALFCLLGFFSL